MSKIFYDHLIVLEKVDLVIKDISETSEEREELWRLVDEIVHNRILGVILDYLPSEHHDEFLERFHKFPFDESHFDWLNQRTHRDIEDVIKEEVRMLEKEIIEEVIDLSGNEG